MSSIKKFWSNVLFIEILYWIVEYLDNTVFLIVFNHLWPINTSMFMIRMCLYIQNCCNSCIILIIWYFWCSYLYYILFNLRILAYSYILFANEMETQISDKIGIYFFNVAINDIHSIFILPLLVFWQFPLTVIWIYIWILNIKVPRWNTFPLSFFLFIMLNWILITYTLWICMFKRLNEFPGTNFLSVKPYNFIVSYAHSIGVSILIPAPSSGTSTLNLHMSLKRCWIINWEFHCIAFPNIFLLIICLVILAIPWSISLLVFQE